MVWCVNENQTKVKIINILKQRSESPKLDDL